MASTDAKPVPQKNVAYRVTFPILDADGDLVTGAAGLDSEISKDGGTFTDCTNEATEIATSSGVYYLDLSSTEMNADTVAVIVKTSTSGAKTTTLVMYPEEAGDVRVNVTQFNGTGVTGRDIGASVLLSTGTGTGQLDFTSGVVKANVTQFGGAAGTFASGRPEVNATHIAGSSVSTSTAQIGVNVVNFGGSAGTFASGRPEVNTTHAAGTAWGSGAITAASIATDAITAAKIAADAIGASELAADAVTEIQSGLATASALSTVAGYVDTEVATIVTQTSAASIRTAVGLASANLDTQLAALQSDTDNIQTRLPAALVSGRIDASVGAMAADTLTASALATSAVTEISTAIGTAATIAEAVLESEIAVSDDVSAEGTPTVRRRLRQIWQETI